MKPIFKILLSSIFALSVFLFWRFGYVEALSYQEQFQLFLFDADYFFNSVAIPGGLCDYISEFLVQFYYITMIGAIILAAVFTIIQILVWQLFKAFHVNNSCYILSFVPSLLLWRFSGDESLLLSFDIALVLCLAMMIVYTKISSNVYKIIFSGLLVGLYMPIGSMIFVVVIFMILYDIKSKSFYPLCYTISILFTSILILVLKDYILFPIRNFFTGLHYYRYPAVINPMQIFIPVFCSVLPFCISKCVDSLFKKPIRCFIFSTIILISAFPFVKSGFDDVKYEYLTYDYLLRTADWNKIITLADKKNPDSPFTFSCLNLALCQTGQLGERMFDYNQNGDQGLFPEFTRDFLLPISTAEVFMRLGLVNEARRYMFEAQEAIPDNRKSGVLLKRITEACIINGEFEVAKKYLSFLKKSLFYSDWADKKSKIVSGEISISNDKFLSTLSNFRSDKDLLFSQDQIPRLLTVLYDKNSNNKAAFDYLAAYSLANKDLESFIQILKFNHEYKNKLLPRYWQQALLVYCVQKRIDVRSSPWLVSQSTIDEMNNFFKNINQNGGAAKKSPASYWKYLSII